MIQKGVVKGTQQLLITVTQGNKNWVSTENFSNKLKLRTELVLDEELSHVEKEDWVMFVCVGRRRTYFYSKRLIWWLMKCLDKVGRCSCSCSCCATLSGWHSDVWKRKTSNTKNKRFEFNFCKVYLFVSLTQLIPFIKTFCFNSIFALLLKFVHWFWG